MKKEYAQDLLNSNGDIKQFLTSAPLNFSLLENIMTSYNGWNIAERPLPNGKRILVYMDAYQYIVHIPTPLFVLADEIQPMDIDDNSQKIFRMMTLNLGTTPRYDISENYDDIKINLVENFDVFNHYLTTRGQPLLTRIISTLTYVRDKYGNTMEEGKYENMVHKILDLKRHYNLKMDLKDMTWEMNV